MTRNFVQIKIKKIEWYDKYGNFKVDHHLHHLSSVNTLRVNSNQSQNSWNWEVCYFVTGCSRNHSHLYLNFLQLHSTWALIKWSIKPFALERCRYVTLTFLSSICLFPIRYKIFLSHGPGSVCILSFSLNNWSLV